jgi:hypothetical protein
VLPAENLTPSSELAKPAEPIELPTPPPETVTPAEPVSPAELQELEEKAKELQPLAPLLTQPTEPVTPPAEPVTPTEAVKPEEVLRPSTPTRSTRERSEPTTPTTPRTRGAPLSPPKTPQKDVVSSQPPAFSAEVRGSGFVRCDCGGESPECESNHATAVELLQHLQMLLGQLQMKGGKTSMPMLNLQMVCEEGDSEETVTVDVIVKVRGKRNEHNTNKCGELREQLGANGICKLK